MASFDDPFDHPSGEIPQNPPFLPPLPPPTTRRRPRPHGIAALAAGSLVSGALGVAAGIALSHQAATSPGSSSAAGAGTPLAPAGNASSGAASQPSASTSSAVVSSVSQAVADITATTASGEVAGTGMVITPDGLLLTNNHVIEGTTGIHVQIDGSGPLYAARVVGDDPTDDVALLRIEGVSGLKTVTLEDSSQVAAGEAAIAIGNAGNRPGAPSASSGSVVAVGRTITAGDDGGSSETLSDLIQVNAVLEPGDSGGPLVDTGGHVIGMDTAAQSGAALQDVSTAGFAIPIDDAMRIVRQIESGDFTASVQPGAGALLGVEVSPQEAAAEPGALVIGVESGSPAQAAGLAAGDVITSLGGQSVDSSVALRSVIRTCRPGQDATVTWISASGQQQSATVTFASGPPA